MGNKQKSVYKKVIPEVLDSGELKRQTTIDLSPWEMGDKTGFTCQIRVIKLGNKPRTSFINIDPFNKEVREALTEMYKQADKLKRL